MRIPTFLRSATLGLLAALLPCAALADDTDIYIDPASPAGSAPMVMLSLDYRPNLTSSVCNDLSSCPQADYFIKEGLAADVALLGGKMVFFDVLRLSLKVVLKRVAGSGLRIGLMINHNNQNNCVGPTASKPGNACSNGGAILLGFNDLLAGDTNGTLKLLMEKLDKLKALKPLANSPDHPYQGAELFYEFFRYLTGQGIFNGHNGGVDFEAGNTAKPQTNMDVYAPASWDEKIEAGANYISPLSADLSCAKVYTINFLFQVAQVEADSLSAMNAAKASEGFGITIPSNDPFTPTIEYLNEVDMADGTFGQVKDIDGVQNVTSYFFVDDKFINNTTIGYAKAGGTGSPFGLGNDPGKLVDDLVNVFRSILSVSTTFVAASVPVNVFNRAQLVDNVYIALFQADAESKPYWNGNVKKLKIKEILQTDGKTKVIELVDSQGAVAVDKADGRIKFDALTFWTNPTPLTDSNDEENIVAGKDGRHVNRGGAGQKIPGFLSAAPGDKNSDSGARQLFYDKGTALAPLNSDLATGLDLLTNLGAVDGVAALALLKYIRGQDTADADKDLNLTEARPWIMGDPLHSRPLPINYGATLGYSTTNPAVFIAVGSNDGYLRMLRNTTSGNVESGAEMWAFMPKNVMGIQKDLSLNATGAPPQHPIGFDGATATLVKDVDGDGNIEPGDGDVVYLYAGLRRGGRAYYGLDITKPDTPVLLWKIDNTTPGFAELGQSFSLPQTGEINVDGVKTAVVFFTGGYDTNKDYDKTVKPTPQEIGSDDKQGRAIYVVDAKKGTLIWSVLPGGSTGPESNTVFRHSELLDSIPSDMTAVDTNGDNLIDRLLVADTGGRLWRADITADGERKTWTMTLLADLGRHVTNDKLNDRRFFHAPDIAFSKDALGPFFAITIGSGDREDPLDKSGITQNYFYVIKDRALGVAVATDSGLIHDKITDVTKVCPPEDTSCAALDLGTGYKFALQEGVGGGEKNLSSPVTLNNVVFFTTYVPATGTEAKSCGPKEGSGFLYAINLKDGSAFYNFDLADGITGSAGDKNKMLASGGIPAQIVLIPAPSGGGILAIAPDLSTFKPPGSTRYRTYWQHVEQ